MEEKRNKLLEFFTREHSFYNIKEIETQGSKFTGVHAMQIKELLQGLVDDGLVNAEKCGVTVVYWCFQYDKIKAAKGQIQKKSERLDELTKSISESERELNMEKEGRVDPGKTAELVQEWKKLVTRRDELIASLSSSVFDEERVNEVKSELKQKLCIAEICADNIESLIYHFQKNNGVDREYFQQELGIPDEFSDLPNLEKFFETLT